MKLVIFAKKVILLAFSLVMFFSFSTIKADAADGGEAFRLLYHDIKAVSLTDGDTGRIIHLNSEKDIQRVANCLNAFRYSESHPEEKSVGYQYMLSIEFKEGTANGAVLSYQFTENSIVVDGERLVAEGIPFGELVSLFSQEPEYLFEDVSSDDRFYNDISQVVENLIFVGLSASRFGTDELLTRAMAVTVLHRLAGSPSASENISFCDVKADSWYAEAVRWATENKIASGTDNAFLPDTPVTREEMAVMMHRYVQLESDANAAGDLSAYADGEDVSPWARKAMEWALLAGIMDCKTNVATENETILDPSGGISRADAAGMIRKLSDYINKLQAVV